MEEQLLCVQGLCVSAPSLPLQRRWLWVGMLPGPSRAQGLGLWSKSQICCVGGIFFSIDLERKQNLLPSVFSEQPARGAHPSTSPRKGHKGVLLGWCFLMECKWLVVISTPGCRKQQVCS